MRALNLNENSKLQSITTVKFSSTWDDQVDKDKQKDSVIAIAFVKKCHNLCVVF